MTLEEITAKYDHPIIGVIGPPIPLKGYDTYDYDDAFRLGYDLREIISNKGTVFTGGLSGVGIDVYRGISDYCVNNEVTDKFFIIVPEGFQPPVEYFQFAEKTKTGVLQVEKVDKGIEKKRGYISAVADLLILINGSFKELNEAVLGLKKGKQIICLQNSGGAADALTKYKNGEAEISLNVHNDLIKPFDNIPDLIKYLSKETGYKKGKK